jgi:hypothetical protein
MSGDYGSGARTRDFCDVLVALIQCGEITGEAAFAIFDKINSGYMSDEAVEAILAQICDTGSGFTN